MSQKRRADVTSDYLKLTLMDMGGSASAKELWRRSEMIIDEFYKTNVPVHGSTLWALYSTLTSWATHLPHTRDTGNDHAATTRIDRDIRVAQMMRIVNDTITSARAA